MTHAKKLPGSRENHPPKGPISPCDLITEVHIGGIFHVFHLGESQQARPELPVECRGNPEFEISDVSGDT